MKAIMFPGQGSQYKGMGKELFKAFPKETALASEILGYDIEELCVKDPERRLGKTEFTQPALYVVNALDYLSKYQGDDTAFLLAIVSGNTMPCLQLERLILRLGCSLLKSAAL